MEVGQDRDRQRSALCRIRAGAQLVEQDEGTFVHLFQERNNVRHVRGKCTQALLDALFVADVCVYLAEDSEL